MNLNLQKLWLRAFHRVLQNICTMKGICKVRHAVPYSKLYFNNLGITIIILMAVLAKSFLLEMGH